MNRRGEPIATDGEGNEIYPGQGSVPILKELAKGRLMVVGTGFYVSRYGLVLTAQHVIEPLLGPEGAKLGLAFIPHLAGTDRIHLRRIIGASYRRDFDLAIAQANNYLDRFPDDPLINKRVTLSTETPSPGMGVITYAYPENAILDFTKEGSTPEIRGDYFSGTFLRVVGSGERPFIPYRHYETTIHLKAGASGGPVFDQRGRVIGVNCRGWEFTGTEQDGDSLSSIVPIDQLLLLRIELAQLPPQSWERRQIPEERGNGPFSIEELGEFGHISFSPPLK